MRRTTALIAVLLATAMALAACGGTATDAAQLETVPVSRVEQLVADPPAGMVVLDIRTPEEYAAGHLAGAVNIDYYAADSTRPSRTSCTATRATGRRTPSP
jgi:phage shock protein E